MFDRFCGCTATSADTTASAAGRPSRSTPPIPWQSATPPSSTWDSGKVQVAARLEIRPMQLQGSEVGDLVLSRRDSSRGPSR